jgi:putative colanic acid polymerase
MIQVNTSSRAFALIIALALIALHLELVTIAGFPLTCAPVIALLVVCRTTKPRVPLLAAIAVCGLFAYVLGVFLLSSSDISTAEFVRTLSLLAFSTLVCLSVATLPLRGSGEWLTISARVVLCVVSLFSLAQFFLFEVHGSPLLYNPWRQHQYLYSYDVAHQYGVTRAQGFYLEPSFNALVLTSAFVILLLRKKSRAMDYALISVGLLTTRSMAGLLIAFTLFLAILFGSHFANRQYLRALVLVLLPILIWGASTYITRRVETVSVVGSSVHYRVVAPVQMISDVLKTHHFGMPLGSVDRVYLTYGVLNGTKVGNSLDNGLYLLVYYFGWTGLILLCSGAFAIILYFLRHPDDRKVLAMLFVFGSLIFTGGILLPDYQLLIALVVLSARYPILADPLVAVPAVHLQPGPAPS